MILEREVDWMVAELCHILIKNHLKCSVEGLKIMHALIHTKVYLDYPQNFIIIQFDAYTEKLQ